MEKKDKIMENISGIILAEKSVFFSVYYRENFTYKQACDYIQKNPILADDKDIQTFLGELMENENKD